MKNLRKVLALVTMLTMLLSVAVSAGTLYPDVDDSASYAQAVETLNALEIMIGDEKGNFNPDASITRAEAAAIVVRLKAQGDLAAVAGATAFTDVPADHWAAGYVNFAQQSGIINGYGDGTFGPSNPVTYEQIIKMIVAALGRTPQAEALGGYPSGYLMVASQEKINKGVSVTVGAEAPRSAVARAAYNALEVEMYGQLSYSNTGEAEFGPNGETLLADYLKVEKVEGIVDATVLTSGTPEDDAFVKIDGVPYLVGDTNAISLLGYAVEAYVAEDEETGDDIIKGITKKSFNSELVLDESLFSDLLTETEGEDETVTSLVIEYVETATSTDEKEAEILGAKRFFNGKADKGDVKTFLDNLNAGDADFGTLTLINNDRDEAYEYVLLTQETDTDQVIAVDLDNLTIDTKGAVGADIDVEDETEFTMFFKADGTVAELADVKKDDVLTVYENGNLKMIYISDAKVEGKVTEVSALKKYGEKVDNEYAIGTEKYRAAYINDEFVKVTAGQEGTFYLDVNGKIAFVDASKVSGNYAYLYTAAEIADINGAAVQMKVLTSEGNWEVLTTAIKVNGNSVFAAEADTEAGIDGLFVTENKKVTEVTPAIFQYKLDKNGYVSQIVIPEATTESGKSYRAADQRIGAVYFTDDTLVFSLPEGAIDDEEDIKLVKATSLFTEGTEYTIDAYDLDEETNVPAIVVTKGATPDILGGTNLLVITKTAETTDEDDQEMTKVYGYQNGAEVEGAFYADCEITAPEGHEIGAGDVVIFSVDADGVINKLEVLMSNKLAADTIKAGTGIGGDGYTEVAPDGEAYDAFGFVYKKDGNRVFLSADGKGENALVDEEGTVLSLSLVGDITVYEVNLDSDIIKTSSVGKIKANVTREGADANWVYVRMYDGAVVDVVVYTQAVVEAE